MGGGGMIRIHINNGTIAQSGRDPFQVVVERKKFYVKVSVIHYSM